MLELQANAIGKKEYLGNRKLEHIIIPCTVKGIDAWGFAYCKKLCCVYIPENISYIEETAFEGCDALREIIVYEQSEGAGDFSPEEIKTYQRESRLLAFGVRHFEKIQQKQLLDFSDIGMDSWYQRYDSCLATYVGEPDDKHFQPFLAGGEEDYEDPSNSIETYCFQKQQEKVRGIFYRLWAGGKISEEQTFTSYIKEHRGAVTAVLQSLGEDSIKGVKALSKYRLLSENDTEEYLAALEGSLFTETRGYLLGVKNSFGDGNRIWNQFEI